MPKARPRRVTQWFETDHAGKAVAKLQTSPVMPFPTIAGSEFVEMFRTAWALELRPTYQKTDRPTPCIFIGRNRRHVGRNARAMSMGSERERALQIG